ncbi:MAG: hypothetical protein H0V82_07920 [Candidatus Protochlamydia sp.]|nr:hypothetical protein [Candidatus Protochlamydia sp.]
MSNQNEKYKSLIENNSSNYEKNILQMKDQHTNEIFILIDQIKNNDKLIENHSILMEQLNANHVKEKDKCIENQSVLMENLKANHVKEKDKLTEEFNSQYSLQQIEIKNKTSESQEKDVLIQKLKNENSLLKSQAVNNQTWIIEMEQQINNNTAKNKLNKENLKVFAKKLTEFSNKL